MIISIVWIEYEMNLWKVSAPGAVFAEEKEEEERKKG